MDGSLPGTSVHGILLGKSTRVGCYVLLQGIFSTQVSYIAGRFFTTEPPRKPPDIDMEPFKHILVLKLTK